MSDNTQSNTNRSLPSKEGKGKVFSWSSWLPDLCAILFFAALSFVYFLNPVIEGQVLTGHDHSGGAGASSEMDAYRKSHDGERTRWTNTLFSGMPTYQMAPSYPSTERLQKAEQAYRLWLPDYVRYIFVMLLGFYILLRAFDFKAWMAALGAVLWAFSSYYFIIIGAGHIWKFYTLAYIPPTIAGMVLCYRGRYGWGLLVTAVFMALQIMSNHVQMTYYFAFVIALMALAFLFKSGNDEKLKSGNVEMLKSGNVETLKDTSTAGSQDKLSTFQRFNVSTFQTWLKGTTVFVLGCLIGIAINASNLYHTWEYSKESMRGKSELTQETKDPADQTSSGLERSYITAWSYGIGETWTLLIPNAKGGASQPLTKSKTAMSKANSAYMQVYQALGQYWGEQPGTSGPVYVGAFVLFLFVLGLLVVKGPMKWALLIATLLSITLAWGKNFMRWTDFFLDYVPMYDKFRTVASILVIAEFTIPLLAMFALKQMVQEEDWWSKHKVAFWSALGVTGGCCFLFWLMPDAFFGNYISSEESKMLANASAQGYIPKEILASIFANLNEMRSAVFAADAGRSLLIILTGCAVLLAFYYKKIKSWAAVACLIVLCTADMWDVNKRYLNDAMFSAPQPPAQFFQKTATDEYILQDTTLYYRVANLAVSTFNDNSTSYWHKSIGGYHAAKLRRYQELIEAYIQPQLFELHQAVAESAGRLDSVRGDSLFPILNMLNMKYAIMPLQGGETVPVQNPWAMGNAWMAERVVLADNADMELADLEMLSEKPTTAILNKALINGEDDSAFQPGSGNITLTSYEANALSYEAETDGGLAVFSEIYYPGWQCTIDGQPASIQRANYVLRAVVLPAGKHRVDFRFDPQSLHTTEAIANTSFIALIILFLGLCGWEIYRRRRPKEE